MQNIASRFWAGIMRKKNINQLSKNIVLNQIDTFLPQASTDALNQEDETLISIESIKDAILDSALNKSPGLDGLPNEFYEAMISRANGIILHLLRDAFIQSKRQGCLPESMRTITMKLLYKYDHEEGKQYPKNYRPIALLPCDYKILSRILQKSLAPHMKYLLYADQFCAENKEI